jgi:intergrase/recombinase
MGEISLNWEEFNDWLNKKYSKTWARNVFCYTKKYHNLLNGNLRELESFSKSKKNNVLKSLIALSKYLGLYETFKARILNYGIKWENQNSFEAFLRIMHTKEGLMKWVKTCLNVLNDSETTFITYVMISGLRKGEAVNSFNLIINLNKEGKLHKYYNSELEALEHFKFEKTFIRGSKNTFFSFIPKAFINQITRCKPISYSTLRKHLRKHKLKSRLSELRDYYATFTIHHELTREEADILQGRIGKSIFMRHYFSPTIKNLRNRTLKVANKLFHEVTLNAVS